MEPITHGLRVIPKTAEKLALYQVQKRNICALVAGENDPITLMATIVCELHHGMPHYHWTGFYRVVAPRLLKIGPYQGTHGCLQIDFDRGVCGAAAREQRTQVVTDVDLVSDHIACSSSTRSEIVVPVFANHGQLVAVLDIDSNWEASFDETDAKCLEQLLHSVFAGLVI